jgi:cytochrome c556
LLQDPVTMSQHRHRIVPGLPGCLVLVASLATGCATQPPAEPPQQAQLLRAISPPARLDPPESLPGTARALLRTRMASHAQDMAALMSAIMILRYSEIEERATAIATEAHFARPHSNDATELNSALPEKFFANERELQVLAGTLAGAAHRLKPFEVANAYGQLSETCVKCHAVYRAGR